MELRFLGNTYSASNYRVNTVNTETTGRFLGKTYTVCRPDRNFQPTLGLKKYRGVTYGIE